MFSVRTPTIFHVFFHDRGVTVVLATAIFLLTFASPVPVQHTGTMVPTSGIAVPASTSNNMSLSQQNVSLLQFFTMLFEIFVSGIVGIMEGFMSAISGSMGTTIGDLAMMYAGDFYPYGIYGPLMFILTVGVGAMGAYGVLSMGKTVEDIE